MYLREWLRAAVHAAVTILAVVSLKRKTIASKILVVLKILAALAVVINLGYELVVYLMEQISSGPYALFYTLLGIIQVIGCFITGLWLKEDAVLVQEAPTCEQASVNHQAVQSAPVAAVSIGDADKLVMLKELLDSGAITQDEFNAKKKQVLGL